MSPATGAAATATRALPLRSPLTTPASRPVRTAALRLVPQRRSQAAKTPFVVVVVAILVGGLLGLLLLNTLVAQDSFALHDLAQKGRALDQQEQDLARQVQAAQAPAALAARATELGMVPGGPPAFLELPSGRVLGQPTPGVAPVASTTWTAPKPPAKPAAAKPGATKPAATKPAATKPAATKPGATKPGAKPATTRPAR